MSEIRKSYTVSVTPLVRTAKDLRMTLEITAIQSSTEVLIPFLGLSKRCYRKLVLLCFVFPQMHSIVNLHLCYYVHAEFSHSQSIQRTSTSSRNISENYQKFAVVEDYKQFFFINTSSTKCFSSVHAVVSVGRMQNRACKLQWLSFRLSWKSFGCIGRVTCSVFLA